MYNNANRFFNYINGKKVAFCGIGISNISAIKILSQKGAMVTACDSKSYEQLKDKVDLLKQLNIKFKFGSDYLNNIDADIIFRTPGMRMCTPELLEAKKKGCIITSEMEVFFDLCPCKIIGVTGSDGKTTVTTIISELLKKEGYKVHIGGNIGTPLLPIIEDINEKDIVVVELSSFQLISMRRSPDVAVVTNLAPNHLDIHKDMAEYTDAKKNIIVHQNAFSKTVLNMDNNITKSWESLVRGRTLFFSSKNKCNNGTFLQDDQIFFAKNGLSKKVLHVKDILIPGKHNIENYLAAISAVFDDVSIETINHVARTFNGVEHRIEFVREIDGVKYYNDSIASSPSRTINGMLSLFDKKIILISGGYDKKIPFDDLATAILDKVKVLVLMGQTADKIRNCIIKNPKFSSEKLKMIDVKNMEEAVKVAKENSLSGDIVALSPSCASFDLYENFAQRGKHFKQLVNNLL